MTVPNANLASRQDNHGDEVQIGRRQQDTHDWRYEKNHGSSRSILTCIEQEYERGEHGERTRVEEEEPGWVLYFVHEDESKSRCKPGQGDHDPS